MPLKRERRLLNSTIMRRLLVLLGLFVASVAHARIGETSFQFFTRYGEPKDTAAARTTDKNSPLVEGAIHHTYEYQGWKLRAAFLHLTGPAVRIDFSKLPNGQPLPIRSVELEAIKTVNTPFGMTWKEVTLNNSTSPKVAINGPVEKSSTNSVGEKMWQRTDGATIYVHDQFTVRLELPAAQKHEIQLKIRRSQKAQASVPKL